MIRTAIALGITVFLSCAPASAETIVSPDETRQGIKVWERNEFPGTSIPSVGTGSAPAVSPPWQAYYECQEQVGGWGCLQPLPEPHDPSHTAATPGRIEEAIRRVRLPALVVHTQPTTRTLVNIETIFYTDPSPVSRTLTILGHQVRIQATAATYTWSFGDRTTQTTTSPGAPYPHQSVTHRYQHPATALSITVSTGYTVRYTIDDGPWQQLDTPINATGPTTTISVVQAQSVLTAP